MVVVTRDAPVYLFPFWSTNPHILPDVTSSWQEFEALPLRRRIRAVSARALESGALVPIVTDPEILSDGGVDFQVRVAASLQRKEAQSRDAARVGDPGRADPFLPYDDALYVADVGANHVGLLNKFNVIDHHLLLVTRAFEDQRDLITRADFTALWMCLRKIDGLGFYNGGAEAGASQPHKHLQLVMLPFADSGPRIPMEPALDLAVAPGVAAGEITASPALAFPHSLIRLDDCVPDPGVDPEGVAEGFYERYVALLAHAGLGVRAGQQRQTAPYNLLVTRRWMLLVPRVAEHFEGVSLNGLAFAGSLFVRDRAQLQTLRSAGPMVALGVVTGAL
jgi:sulfate adenylyltransferase (ADP) / ATP adenylyltransferase